MYIYLNYLSSKLNVGPYSVYFVIDRFQREVTALFSIYKEPWKWFSSFAAFWFNISYFGIGVVHVGNIPFFIESHLSDMYLLLYILKWVLNNNRATGQHLYSIPIKNYITKFSILLLYSLLNKCSWLKPCQHFWPTNMLILPKHVYIMEIGHKHNSA